MNKACLFFNSRKNLLGKLISLLQVVEISLTQEKFSLLQANFFLCLVTFPIYQGKPFSLFLYDTRKSVLNWVSRYYFSKDSSGSLYDLFYVLDCPCSVYLKSWKIFFFHKNLKFWYRDYLWSHTSEKVIKFKSKKNRFNLSCLYLNLAIWSRLTALRLL